MIISFIVAASENNAIGIHNKLPWHLPEDLKFFKRTTLGKPVIMGRKTFDSIDLPLSGRLNIVVSSNKEMVVPDGVLLYDTINAAVERMKEEPAEEGFILGGGQIFKAAMPLADRIYITRVHTTIDNADAFFPEIDHTHWKLVWEEPHNANERHKYAFTFQKFERIAL